MSYFPASIYEFQNENFYIYRYNDFLHIQDFVK